MKEMPTLLNGRNTKKTTRQCNWRWPGFRYPHFRTRATGIKGNMNGTRTFFTIKKFYGSFFHNAINSLFNSPATWVSRKVIQYTAENLFIYSQPVTISPNRIYRSRHDLLNAQDLKKKKTHSWSCQQSFLIFLFSFWLAGEFNRCVDVIFLSFFL